jgi:hypothetical protein
MGYRVLVDKRRNRVLAVADVKGYFSIRGYGLVRNKFTRNIGFIVDGLLRRADVTVYDQGGTGRTAGTSNGGLSYSPGSSNDMGPQFFVVFGTSTTTPTVTDNNLGSLSDWLYTNVFDVVDEADQTSLVLAGR